MCRYLRSGVPAERAWLAPLLLRERLGHFDLNKIAEDLEP